MGSYPSIQHDEDLKVLRNQNDKFIDKTVPTEDIIKMAEFVLKNNLFGFNSKFYKQISGTAIGKVCSTVCLHFYGLHRNGNFKISGDKTLASEKIHRYFFHLDRYRGKS